MDPARPSELHLRVRPFVAAVATPGVELDELALALSAVLQPGLDMIGSLAALDVLAADCPTPTRDGVFQFLFGSGLLRGDRADYDSWQNSCLDRVLATRHGMPITLSVIAIEVARRIGVELVGIGMPGHFLVADPDEPGWYADPFHARHGLDPGDCRAVFRRVTGGRVRWSDGFLAPVSSRMIVARILNNLKAGCVRRQDPVRLALVMRMRAAMPEIPAEPDEERLSAAVLN